MELPERIALRRAGWKELAGLGVSFTFLCANLYGWGQCELVNLFVKACFRVATGTLGKVPVIGGWVNAPAHAIEAKITHIIGGWILGFEGRIGQYWRDLGDVAGRLGYQLLDDAALILGIAVLLGLLAKYLGQTAVTAVRGHKTATTTARAHAQTVTREHAHHKTHTAVETKVIHKTTVIVRDDARWRGYTKRQLRYLRAALAAATAAVFGHVIAGTGERVGGLVGGLTGIRHRLGRVERLLGAGALTAATVGVLAKLGWGWIACRNWKRLGREVCKAPPHYLNDILALVTDFAVLANICQVLPWLEAAASEVAAPLVSGLTTAGAGLCQGASRPAKLPVAKLYLPPVQGVTLYLPE